MLRSECEQPSLVQRANYPYDTFHETLIFEATGLKDYAVLRFVLATVTFGFCMPVFGKSALQ